MAVLDVAALSLHAWRSSRRRAARARKDAEIQELREKLENTQRELAEWWSWWRSGELVERPCSEHGAEYICESTGGFMTTDNIQRDEAEGSQFAAVDTAVSRVGRASPGQEGGNFLGSMAELVEKSMDSEDDNMRDECFDDVAEDSESCTSEAVEDIAARTNQDIFEVQAARLGASGGLVLQVRDWLQGEPSNGRLGKLLKGYAELMMGMLRPRVADDITEVQLMLAVACAMASVDHWCCGVWEDALPEQALKKIGEEAAYFLKKFKHGNG